VDNFSIKGVIMKKMAYGILLMILLAGSACGPVEIDENVSIPKADIVYQAINYQTESDVPSNNLVGFVNADGSDNVKIKLDYRPYTPVVSREWGGIVFRFNAGNPPSLDESVGPIYFLKSQGTGRVCDQSYYESFFFPMRGENSVLVFGSDWIGLVDIGTCKVVKTLIKISDQVPWVKYIGSATPSDSGNKVIFYEFFDSPVQPDKIYIIDVDTGKMNEVLEGGHNPSLSPDEKRIAYISSNGIYIANANGTGIKLLVPITISDELYKGLDPHPFWSPDGTTLIYHKCHNTVCKNVSDFSIYKVNVNTGLEAKIVDGGLYPTWIK
jgi:hypothetical protein